MYFLLCLCRHLVPPVLVAAGEGVPERLAKHADAEAAVELSEAGVVQLVAVVVDGGYVNVEMHVVVCGVRERVLVLCGVGGVQLGVPQQVQRVPGHHGYLG